MRARPASASAGSSAARSAQRGTLELVDLLCERDVRVGKAVSNVRREDDPDRLVGLEVDVRVVVRGGRGFRDPADERDRSLEALEREGLRQGAAFAGPARAPGQEGSGGGPVGARLLFGGRDGLWAS